MRILEVEPSELLRGATELSASEFRTLMGFANTILVTGISKRQLQTYVSETAVAWTIAPRPLHKAYILLRSRRISKASRKRLEAELRFHFARMQVLSAVLQNTKFSGEEETELELEPATLSAEESLEEFFQTETSVRLEALDENPLSPSSVLQLLFPKSKKGDDGNEEEENPGE